VIAGLPKPIERASGDAVGIVYRRPDVSESDVVVELTVKLGNIMGTPWDVANATLFLASDEARLITGTHLSVDGGRALKRG